MSGVATGDVKQKHRVKRDGSKGFGALVHSLQCDIELDKPLTAAMLVRKLFVINESETHLPAVNRECTQWKAYVQEVADLAGETKSAEDRQAKEREEQQS